MQNDGETLFKAQINVGGKDYNKHRPPELSNNLITELIKEFHHKKTAGPGGAAALPIPASQLKQLPKGLVSGKNLDPALVEKFAQ